MRKLIAYLLDSGPVLGLAVIAFAGSFSHVRQTAVDHGQTGSMGVAVAVCVDLLCLVAARERQRDKRAGRRTGWPTAVLVGGVLLSLGANLAQAEPTMWGLVAAGTPCAAFVVAVSLLERRRDHKAPERPRRPRRAHEPKRATVVRHRPLEGPKKLNDDDLITRARELAEGWQRDGHSVTRDRLKSALGVSTARATAVRRELRAAGI